MDQGGAVPGLFHRYRSKFRHSSCCRAVIWNWFVREAVKVLKLALPLFLWYNFQELPFFLVLLFVGHYGGSQELSAAALGSAIVNLSGMYVILGLAMAADTLLPQSYGFKNYRRVGIILQRGIMILLLASIPIAMVWLNSESILLLLRQVPCVARLTGLYTRIFVAALPAIVVYVMLVKYLSAQSMVWIFVVIGLATNLVLVIICVVYVTVRGTFGTLEAAVIMAGIFLLSPLILLVYIKLRKIHAQTWGGWSFDSLAEWWQFLRLSLSGLLMVAFEWWSFEISALVTGSIDELQLATNSVLLQLTNFTYSLALGMASAVNVRVGNELGAGNVMSAKRATLTSLTMHTGMSLVLTSLIFTFRNQIGRIFTNEENVVKEIADAMIGAIGIFFFDQIQGVMWGVMRACGRQTTVAVVGFLCYWVLGLPLGITLALVVGLNAKGMWIGISVAGGVQTIILSVLIATTNWKKYSDLAVKNAQFSQRNPTESENVIEEDTVELAAVISNVNTEPSDSSTLERRETFSEPSENINLIEGETVDHEEDTARNKEDVARSEDEARDGEVDEDTVRADTVDTRTLISAADSDETVPTSRPVYNTSSRFCLSKTSILVCRALLLLMGVVFLAVGVVLSATIRHRNPVGCGANHTFTNETYDSDDIFTTDFMDQFSARTSSDMAV